MEQKLVLERSGDDIVLKCGEAILETYSFSSTIDFKGLLNYLMADELLSKFSLEDNVKEKKPQEEKLVALLTRIIDMYNKHVDAFAIYQRASENKS
jgi:hypothetical protein